MGKKKRGRNKNPLVVDLNDPSVQKRIQRFGPPTGDSDFAKAYRAAEAKLLVEKRKNRFGTGSAAPVPNASVDVSKPQLSAEDQKAIEARKLKFGLQAK